VRSGAGTRLFLSPLLDSGGEGPSARGVRGFPMVVILSTKSSALFRVLSDCDEGGRRRQLMGLLEPEPESDRRGGPG